MGRKHRTRSSGLLSQIVRYAAGLVVVLLAIRFVLVLLPSAALGGFRQLVGTLTAPLVSPFTGLVHYAPTTSISGSQILTLIAIVAYLILAWLLIKLMTLGRQVSY